MYKRIKQQLTKRPLNGEVVCFFFQRSTLLAEVRKRTSYLGSKRRSKDGTLLLDQIAMTNDESDLFYSYLLDASAHVYDVLSGIMPEDTASYRIFGRNIVHLALHPSVVPQVTTTAWTSFPDSAGVVTDVVDTDIPAADLQDSDLVGNLVVRYEVQCVPIGSVTPVVYTKQIKLRNVEVKAHNNWSKADIAFVPVLSPATATSDAETFNRIIGADFDVCHAVLHTPVTVSPDDVVEINGKYYQTDDAMTVSTEIDMAGINELPFDCTDGVLFRIGERSSRDAGDFGALDTNALPAIDIGIYNMIVYHIMWNWFLSASPDDAETYNVLEKQVTDTLCTRMTRLKSGRAEITPRNF